MWTYIFAVLLDSALHRDRSNSMPEEVNKGTVLGNISKRPEHKCSRAGNPVCLRLCLDQIRSISTVNLKTGRSVC